MLSISNTGLISSLLSTSSLLNISKTCLIDSPASP